jgi:hypothetical protein
MKLRSGLLAAVVALVPVLATALPAAAEPVAPGPVVQSFYADSGDACVAGYTRGVLGWESGPPSYRVVVAVRGAVVDRPTPTDPRACPADSRFTVATFTAYVGRTAVDSNYRRADNGTVTFGFTLGVNSNLVTIDRVTVQVCRLSLLPGPYDYCGAPVDYFAPVRTTG